jgi:phospholipase/carboxylesterase
VTNPHEGAAVLGGWRHEYAPGDPALPALPALLMLHGTGGDEREMMALGRSLAPGAALLAPRGRVSEGGMARFFSRAPDAPFRFPDIEERIDELAGLVRAALVEYGLGGRPLYGVGYSNGANAATALLLRHPGLLDGVVALRGLLPVPAPGGLDMRDVRVLVAAGQADAMIPAGMARELIAALRDRGADVTEHWSARGHGLGQDDLDAAAAWLATPVRR